MTHFVTLAYLRLFAAPLLLLAAARGEHWPWLKRTLLVAAAGAAAYRVFVPPEEVFSRQLAADALFGVATAAIALASWHAKRQALLAAFFLSLIAGSNDLMTLAVSGVLAAAALNSPRRAGFIALTAAALYATSSGGEFAIVLTRAPIAASIGASLCATALFSIRDWGAKIAALALSLRFIALAWLPYGSRLLLQ